jgi:F-type H+-transporting ATPase subunit alpha
LSENRIDSSLVAAALRGSLANYREEIRTEEVGEVAEVEEGIARVRGLPNVMTEEMLLFEGGVLGMAFNLEQDEVGTMLLGDASKVAQGSLVHRLDRVLSVPVGEELLGRVVNALAEPIDVKGPIAATQFREVAGPSPHVAAPRLAKDDIEKEPDSGRPSRGLRMRALEAPAPGVTDRQPVKEPLQTGLKCIDSMIPLGRGQRELIIGDRQTGKTSLAIDTILNQKGSDVYCIYVAIGQKLSSVVSVVDTLQSHGAMDYTVVVSATAAEPATLQYIAPYTGCTIGEHFRDVGRHALVIYDDLYKHAIAYRTISLLLRRPPGREAFPGDIFNIHSRLLERAAKLAEKFTLVPVDAPDTVDPPDQADGRQVWQGEEGREAALRELAASHQASSQKVAKIRGTGGSLSALPVVETLEGDYSAYIPTNIISITDGQIYLEADLFRAGVRPALNVGLSVSRVGGHAQTKAMRQVAGQLRIELAQYRELAAFAQISGDLDAISQGHLTRGERLVELLKQPVHRPLSVAKQVLSLWMGAHGYLDDIQTDRVAFAEQTFLTLIENRFPELLQLLNERLEIDEEIEGLLRQAAKELRLSLGVGSR